MLGWRSCVDPPIDDGEREMSKQVTTSKRLIHNTLFNLVTFMSNALVVFFLIPFFLGQLGEVRYGLWVFIGSIFRYRGILNLGLNSAISRHIPVCFAKDDDEGIQRVVNTALFYFSSLSFVLVAVSFLIYYNAGSWLPIDPHLVRVTGLLVLIVGLGAAVSSLLQLGAATLSGLQRYDAIGVVTIVTLTVRTVLVVVLLYRGYGLLMMGCVFGISEIMSRALLCYSIRRLLPNVSLNWRSVDFALLKDMLFYGVNTFLYTIGGLIVLKASALVIGILIGMAEVSQFFVAAAAVILMSQFLQAFTGAIKPAVSDLDARDDQARVKEIGFLTQKYSLLFIIPAGCFLAVMGKEFLTVWAGGKFDDPTTIDSLAPILTILTVGHCVRLAQHSNFLVLVGRGQHRVFGILTALMALLCLLGSILTVKVLGWGLIGIAWSNLLPMVLISGVTLSAYYNLKMKISTWESITHVWWPAALGCLPSIMIITTWKWVSPPDSWLEIFAVVVAAAAATFAFSWIVSLEPIERERLVGVLSRGRLRSGTQSSQAP